MIQIQSVYIKWLLVRRKKLELDVIEKRKNIINVLSQKEDFIVIALTGRMGSGCSTVADILTKKFDDLNMPWPVPGYRGMRDDEERDVRILIRYANSHWIAFEKIRVRTIITTFY